MIEAYSSTGALLGCVRLNYPQVSASIARLLARGAVWFHVARAAEIRRAA